MPKISSDGKTYELKLRKGLKYSDGTPVKASDFEHSIQARAQPRVGRSAFFLGIEGAAGLRRRTARPRPTSRASRPTTQTGKITIKLTEPGRLVLERARDVVRRARSGRHAVQEPDQGPAPGRGSVQDHESVPNRQFVLEKNKNLPTDIPDDPPGNIDKITTKIVKNAQRQAQDVISGKLDYMQDPPPADIKPEVKAKYSDRYREVTTASTYYFFMNTRVPPFDDPKVREAVNWGIDKPGLARLFAGEVTPGCSFLPPGMPGYDEASTSTAARGATRTSRPTSRRPGR